MLTTLDWGKFLSFYFFSPFSSDYDGAVKVPFATDDLVYLTQGLIDEKFTDEEIRKIMGGNNIRLLLKGLPSK